MKKNRKLTLAEVTFTYTGTDEQFTEFLKMMVHDYLTVDHPHTASPDFVGKVDSDCA